MQEVTEKPKKVTRALLVGVQRPDETPEQAESLLTELAELVQNIDVEVVETVVARVREIHPRFLLGTGKTAALLEQAKSLDCDVIVFDEPLSPAQQRNWEAEGKLAVIDRQEVILDIFHDRAHTKEAVLQVELARQEYNLPRLKRAWTHLSRQRGGGTTQRGEGEAQIELDQRMVRDRIARLKRELAQVRRQRATQRKQRGRVPLPTAALVGYTNAGKSSLLNALTGAHIYAADKLFATLDPTTRQLALPGGTKLLLTDTVGFVRRLPHGLVDAFKATLEEAILADFLLHVIDASSPEAEEHAATTLGVLRELGADEKNILTVYNKTDRLAPGEAPWTDCEGTVHAVSALTGAGLPELAAAMEEKIAAHSRPMKLLVPHDRYDLVHRLHEIGGVSHEEPRAEGVLIKGNIPRRFVTEMEPFRLNGHDPGPATP